MSSHFPHPPLWLASGSHPWLQRLLETRAMSMWRIRDKNPFRNTPSPKLWFFYVQWGTQVAQHGEVTSLRQRPFQHPPQKENTLLANPHHFCTSKSSGQMEARTKIQVKTSTPKSFALRRKQVPYVLAALEKWTVSLSQNYCQAGFQTAFFSLQFPTPLLGRQLLHQQFWFLSPFHGHTHLPVLMLDTITKSFIIVCL